MSALPQRRRIKSPRLLRNLALAACLALLSPACSTIPVVDYPTYRDEFAQRFQKGDYQGAAALTAAGAERSGPDRLVFLLDRSMALHALGQYEQANRLLWEAEKISAPHSFASEEKLR